LWSPLALSAFTKNNNKKQPELNFFPKTKMARGYRLSEIDRHQAKEGG
jgi:hypothetical protein